MFMVVI